MRNLVLILGDQLLEENPVLTGFDVAQDCVVMIEAVGEAKSENAADAKGQLWSHKARIALFLSAMRHFAQVLRAKSLPLRYLSLADWPETPVLLDRLLRIKAELNAQNIVVCAPSDYALNAALIDLGAEIREDTHFLITPAAFKLWAAGYKSSLRMEYFYRLMRVKYGVLLEDNDKGGKNDKAPLGGQWNFDKDNRSAYAKTGPDITAAPAMFPPDEITQAVFKDVEIHFADHPGELKSFGWAVTRQDALIALAQFIQHRLPSFGQFQDAMWTNTPFGWHSLLSAALNLRLLNPLEVIRAAEAAYQNGQADLAATEGFIRQILGWREFIRGVYWRNMPRMKTANHFGHHRPLPQWYWTGKTNMACMRDTIGQTLEHGYAHHIQRLMVTGQFALLAEIEPAEVAGWYLSVYVDALEWVELPNVMGMALFADGGLFTSKPYIASGQYINKQGNYCKTCQYKPDVRTGPKACPVSVLYWRHLDKHQAALAKNPRTALMANSIARLSDTEREAIRDYSTLILENIDTL